MTLAQIFIVEDHPIMRESVRMLLERQSGMAVQGEAATAESALAALAQNLPDLVLIDVSLPGMNGIELAQTIHKQYPALPVMILSGHGEKNHVEQALMSGARGYVLKGNADELPGAIRQVLSGERYLSAEIVEKN